MVGGLVAVGVAVRSAGMTGAPWREESIVDMAEHEAMIQNNRYTEIVYASVGREPLNVVAPKGGSTSVAA